MKKKTYIIIISIIVIIIVVGFIIFNDKEFQKVSYINSVNKYDDTTVTVGNMHVLYDQYYGNINSMVIDKALFYIATELIPTYKDIDNVDDYYQKNSKTIYKFTGIENKTEFEKIVNKVKKLNGEKLTFEKYSFENTYEREDGGIKGVLWIQYKGNEKIHIYVMIHGKLELDRVPVTISADIKNENLYNKERDEEEIDKEIHPELFPGKVIK